MKIAFWRQTLLQKHCRNSSKATHNLHHRTLESPVLWTWRPSSVTRRTLFWLFTSKWFHVKYKDTHLGSWIHAGTYTLAVLSCRKPVVREKTWPIGEFIDRRTGGKYRVSNALTLKNTRRTVRCDKFVDCTSISWIWDTNPIHSFLPGVGGGLLYWCTRTCWCLGRRKNDPQQGGTN